LCGGLGMLYCFLSCQSQQASQWEGSVFMVTSASGGSVHDRGLNDYSNGEEVVPRVCHPKWGVMGFVSIKCSEVRPCSPNSLPDCSQIPEGLWT